MALYLSVAYVAAPILILIGVGCFIRATWNKDARPELIQSGLILSISSWIGLFLIRTGDPGWALWGTAFIFGGLVITLMIQ